MKLDTLFQQLAFNELSQHKLSVSKVIKETDYPTVISHLNTALTALFSEFPLSYKEVTIKQFEGITDYILDTKYSVSEDDPTVTEKYIYDTEENPFLDDVLRIDSGYDARGHEVPINDIEDVRSWFTPNPNTIQMPSPTEGALVAVIYRANHLVIPMDTVDLSAVTVNIPACLEEALRAYIASIAFVSLGNQTSAQLSSYFKQLYLSKVIEVKRLNLLQTSHAGKNMKFINGGWR